MTSFPQAEHHYWLQRTSRLILGGALLLLVTAPLVTLADSSKAIALVNVAREKVGLTPLKQNPTLDAAALAKANDMFEHDYFAHVSPTGRTPWYWFQQAGYDYRSAGENLAINYDDPEEQQKAWMNSSTHRANILNQNFQEIGMASKKGKIDGQEAFLTVQLFGTPRVAVVAKSDEPTQSVAEAPQTIQGVATETAPEALSLNPTNLLPEITLPTVTVIVNKTILERIEHSALLSRALPWAQAVAGLLLISVAMALPVVLVAEMTVKLWLMPWIKRKNDSNKPFSKELFQPSLPTLLPPKRHTL